MDVWGKYMGFMRQSVWTERDLIYCKLMDPGFPSVFVSLSHSPITICVIVNQCQADNGEGGIVWERVCVHTCENVQAGSTHEIPFMQPCKSSRSNPMLTSRDDMKLG